MPIQHAIWKVGTSPESLAACKLVSEKMLEDMIVACPAILSSDWLLIGRQERTNFGGIIDLLAIAPDGSLVLIELKRDKTPREIVAQSIDYASWVENLTAERLAQIHERFCPGKSLSDAFRDLFHEELDEESLNQSHQIVIVASELDDSTERIIGYLNARDIAINAIFFQVFQCGGEQLLSRAWLIDPAETQANVGATSKTAGDKEPWNGEFYVSFGTTTSRSWDDARKFGYISAGGGSWYTKTLKLLSPGDRVWVKVPQKGYVGVGVVTEPVVNVNDFTVTTDEGEKPALNVLQHASLYRQSAADLDKAEHFVKVTWLDTVPEDQAFDEVGLFGNQNTVCKPTTPKWRHTVERLKSVFPKWNDINSAKPSA
ncbi:MAG: hypothetical protein WBC44_08855 [Planctomycetaceae bacterium]